MTGRRGGDRGRNFGGLNAVHDAFIARQARAQALLAKQASATPRTAVNRLERRGIKNAIPVQFAERRRPDTWLSAGAGAPVVRAILDGVADGIDRSVLAWPAHPGSGFVAGAIAMRQARSSGELAHATFGYWPWRPGATAAAKQVLVDPDGIVQVARAVATEMREHNATWLLSGLAHEPLFIVEMSLGALKKSENLRSQDIVVRRPTLLETTAAFPPDLESSGIYKTTSDHLLYRVQRHTWLRKAINNADGLLRQIENPQTCPFAMFGLPNSKTLHHVERCLRHERIKQLGLDVVIVDLTRAVRNSLVTDWDKAFEALLRALDGVPGRRPAVVALCDDAFTLRRVSRLIRIHNAARKPAGPPLKQIGAYLAVPGLLGPATELPQELSNVDFKVDIKDAELAPLRSDLVGLGRALRESGNAKAASGVSQALAFLKRVASLPVGLDEASDVARQIYDGDDDGDARRRALFMPKMELKPLADVEIDAPAHANEAQRLCRKIEEKICFWKTETPVSMKLSALLDSFPDKAEGVLVVIADRRVADVFLSTDRAVKWRCTVRDRNGLEEFLARGAPSGLVIVGPTPEVIRSILISTNLPKRVDILGDVAGIGLVMAELGPAEQLDAFAALKPRAIALKQQISRHGGDESLDIRETEFGVAAIIPEGVVDLTRSGGAYVGDKVRIETASRGVYLYRPTSDVLVYSQSEGRAFEKTDASKIEVGMEILALGQDVRDDIRQALAGSKKVLEQIRVYHS